MPATAGRVRMPANNRVHSSSALQTHSIWKSIGYDPYAPINDDSKSSNSEPDHNSTAYDNYQNLLHLAKITGANGNKIPGACPKCGRVGHYKYQCRNFISFKDDEDKDQAAVDAAVEFGLQKLKANGSRIGEKDDEERFEDSSDEEDESSEESDSDVDSDIERIIAARQGKRVKTLSKRKRVSDDSDSDSDFECRRKRKGEKRRRRDSSDEENLGRHSRRDNQRRHYDHRRRSRH
ncbi:hypothetical protein ACHQM5_021581 [Ranunculus cassubicifolius]